MTITYVLADAGGGTDLRAVHDRLPRGLSPTDHEAGWQSSLAKRAALVEAVHRTGDDWPPDSAAPIKKARTP